MADSLSSRLRTQRGFVSEHLRQPVVQTIEQHGRAFVVRLLGELDLYNAGDVRSALADVAAQEPERVVVDLEEVTFIDSTGLGVLVEARTKLANRRAFLLSRPQVETKRALEISGLAKQIPVYDTLEQALASQV
jgi:anti-sigma B factor antagonist